MSLLVSYYPYGKILREYHVGQIEKYQSTQHERDQERLRPREFPLKTNLNEQTGLDYRGARFYDSDVGRFLSLDPHASDYVSWSAFNYVLSNPVSFIDPDGRNAIKTGKDLEEDLNLSTLSNEIRVEQSEYILDSDPDKFELESFQNAIIADVESVFEGFQQELEGLSPAEAYDKGVEFIESGYGVSFSGKDPTLTDDDPNHVTREGEVGKYSLSLRQGSINDPDQHSGVMIGQKGNILKKSSSSYYKPNGYGTIGLEPDKKEVGTVGTFGTLRTLKSVHVFIDSGSGTSLHFTIDINEVKTN